MRCKICGKKIKWDKSKLYMVRIVPSTIQVIAGGSTKVFDAMDCERCGAQNLINVRETNVVHASKNDLTGNDIEQIFIDEDIDLKEDKK